jgi:hypothetical protein
MQTSATPPGIRETCCRDVSTFTHTQHTHSRIGIYSCVDAHRHAHIQYTQAMQSTARCFGRDHYALQRLTRAITMHSLHAMSSRCVYCNTPRATVQGQLLQLQAKGAKQQHRQQWRRQLHRRSKYTTAVHTTTPKRAGESAHTTTMPSTSPTTATRNRQPKAPSPDYKECHCLYAGDTNTTRIHWQ